MVWLIGRGPSSWRRTANVTRVAAADFRVGAMRNACALTGLALALIWAAPAAADQDGTYIGIAIEGRGSAQAAADPPPLAGRVPSCRADSAAGQDCTQLLTGGFAWYGSAPRTLPVTATPAAGWEFVDWTITGETPAYMPWCSNALVPTCALNLRQGSTTGEHYYVVKARFRERVDVSAPTVALSAPAPGTSFAPGAAIGLSAVVSDDDPGAVSVEFLVDGAQVASDVSGADGFTAAIGADALGAGPHVVVARARDSRQSADSAPVMFTTVRALSAPSDADGDGVSRPLDCNDGDPAIRPGAIDPPADRVDQDCSGADASAPRILSLVSYDFDYRRSWSRASRLTIKDLPAGASVELACKGSGCPFKSRRTAVPRARSALSVLAQLRRARLRPGATLVVRITKAGMEGRSLKFTVRRGKAPRLTSAVLPVQHQG